GNGLVKAQALIEVWPMEMEQANPNEESLARRPWKRGRALPRLSVLLVEDDPTITQVVSRNLTGRGYRFYQSATATEAIDAAMRLQPDLLLLDINLPDRSGWDVLRQLKSRGVEIPTAVVSAVRVSPARLEEFHPVAYLPKPFPIEALLRVVADAAARKKREKTDMGSRGPSATAGGR
ncbi:MAG TPA: response regulator, partial [Chloroflexota bacterium]|nr:response regulator [Chloroflexota bacterium]